MRHTKVLCPSSADGPASTWTSMEMTRNCARSRAMLCGKLMSPHVPPLFVLVLVLRSNQD